MLTEMKHVVKTLPVLRKFFKKQEKLRQTITQLQAELAEYTKWGLPCFNGDCMVNFNKNMAFMKEEAFVRAYRAGVSSGGFKNARAEDFHIEWRAHMIIWAAQHAKNLPGDFVECGVNKGFFSVALCNYIDFNATGKSFYLFDTYQGIPEDQILESERGHADGANKNSYEECFEIAKRNFAPFPRAQLIRGKVPDTLTTVAISKVCYLSIDMNIVAPEIAAMRFFWDKLVPGAVVVFDDYGWAPRVAQKNAMDAFAAEKGVAIATLPTGQGLLLKPN